MANRPACPRKRTPPNPRNHPFPPPPVKPTWEIQSPHVNFSLVPSFYSPPCPSHSTPRPNCWLRIRALAAVPLRAGKEGLHRRRSTLSLSQRPNQTITLTQSTQSSALLGISPPVEPFPLLDSAHTFALAQLSLCLRNPVPRQTGQPTRVCPEILFVSSSVLL